jgi:medium-chain acyl-[acyl-carrier-protein] hydrolase
MNSNPWITCFKPNPQAKLRLFCLPYAGGSSSMFRTWAGQLPMEIELWAIELPGRGPRLAEAPFQQIPSLVKAMAMALQPKFDKPFACFGHSLGALLSFELTRYLRQTSNQVPIHLFISGRPAPQLPITEPFVHTLPDPAFIEELRRLNGTPQAILDHPELMALLLPTIRADFTALETYIYEPQPPLESPLSVFGGLTDPEASQEELTAWQTQTQGEFALKMFPGDHFFIHSAEPAVLEAICTTRKHAGAW